MPVTSPYLSPPRSRRVVLPQPFFHHSSPSPGHHLPQPWLGLCTQSPSVLPASRGDLACPSTAQFPGCYLSMAWFDTSLSRAMTDGSPGCSKPAQPAQSQPGAVTELIFLALSWDCSQAQLSLPSPTFFPPIHKGVCLHLSAPPGTNSPHHSPRQKCRVSSASPNLR